MQQTGYAVYYQNKIYIWDGSQWQTWLNGVEIANNLCCKQAVNWSKYSDASSQLYGGYIPSGLKIGGGNCNYYNVKITGQWGAYPQDNDENIDFRTTPIWVQFLARENETADWTIVRSKQYTWSSGDTIDINEEFTFQSLNEVFVGCSISTDRLGRGVAVQPIANYSRYWLAMTVDDCPHSSWQRRYSIPATGILPQGTFQGEVPSELYVSLPFDGFYSADIYIGVREWEDAGGTSVASTTAPQMLELSGDGTNWLVVDTSGVVAYFGPADQIKWMNLSLQGSATIYTEYNGSNLNDCKFRKIYWKVNLPNGSYKQLIGGYLHLKYLGKKEGYNCK